MRSTRAGSRPSWEAKERPTSFQSAPGTQVWLAADDDPDAAVTGRYFKWQRDLRANPDAYGTQLQDALLAGCATLTGVALPD